MALHVINKRATNEKKTKLNRVPAVLTAFLVLSCSLSTSSDSREGYCLSMIKTTRLKFHCFFSHVVIACGNNLYTFTVSTLLTYSYFHAACCL